MQRSALILFVYAYILLSFVTFCCIRFQLQRGISTLSTASASSSNQLMPEFDAVDADVNVGGEDGLAAAEDPTNSDIQVSNVNIN